MYLFCDCIRLFCGRIAMCSISEWHELLGHAATPPHERGSIEAATMPQARGPLLVRR